MISLNFNDIHRLWPSEIPHQKYNLQEDDIHDERIWGVADPRLHFYKSSHALSPFVAMICPGGAYRKLNPLYEGEKLAIFLNAIGIDCYVLISRLPVQENLTIGYKATISDAQRGVRMIRKLNPKKKILGVGVSAGGHLISTLPILKDEAEYGDNNDIFSFIPDVSLLISPVTIMNEYVKQCHQPSRERFGLNISSYSFIYKDITPPTFIVHASDDKTVSVVNSLLYAEELAVHDVPFALIIPSIGGHDLCSQMQHWLHDFFNFLKTQNK